MEPNIENKYVIFKLENEYFGLSIDNVLSIEKMQEYTRVPNVASYVKGVMNLRGEVVPIIDLRDRLGLEPKDIDLNTRIIIVAEEELVVGFIVDSCSEVLEISKEDIDKPPTTGENNFNEYIKGIGKNKERLIILIDLERLLEN